MAAKYLGLDSVEMKDAFLSYSMQEVVLSHLWIDKTAYKDKVERRQDEHTY